MYPEVHSYSYLTCEPSLSAGDSAVISTHFYQQMMQMSNLEALREIRMHTGVY